MYRKFLLVLPFIIFLLSCDSNLHSALFFVENEDIYYTTQVEKNSVIIEPDTPSRKGYTFQGWYIDDTLYDFDAFVTSDLNI